MAQGDCLLHAAGIHIHSLRILMAEDMKQGGDADDVARQFAAPILHVFKVATGPKLGFYMLGKVHP